MTKKLTLSIEQKVIERAKRISHQKGKSISKIVEEYLDFLIKKMKVNPLRYRSYQGY